MAINESFSAVYWKNDRTVRVSKWQDVYNQWTGIGPIYLDTFFPSGAWPIQLEIQDGLVMVFEKSQGKFVVSRWDGGTSWTNVIQDTYDKYENILFRKEHYLRWNNYNPDYLGLLYLYHFDGTNYVYGGSTDYTGKPNFFNTSYLASSENHVLVCEYTGGPGSFPVVGKVYVHDRTQGGWNWQLLKSETLATGYGSGGWDEHYSLTCSISDQFIAILKRRTTNSTPNTEGPIWVWRWTGSSWEQYGTDGQLPNSTFANSQAFKYAKLAAMGNNIVLHTYARFSGEQTGFTKVWSWNGSTWSGPQDIFTNNNYVGDDRELFIGNNFVGSYCDIVGSVKIRLTHGLSEWDNTVEDYPVEYITESDGYTTETIKTKYTFSTVKYDPLMSLAGYNLAKTEPEGLYGYTLQYSYNTITGDSRKFGFPYATYSYKEGTTTNPVQQTSTPWEVYTLNQGNQRVKAYQVRLQSPPVRYSGWCSNFTIFHVQ